MNEANHDPDPPDSPVAVRPVYDEAALDRFAEEGRVKWADVPNASAWVDWLRGHGESANEARRTDSAI